MDEEDKVSVSFPLPGNDGRSALGAFRAACKATNRLVQVKMVYIRYVAEVNTVEQTFKIAFGLDLIWPATEAEKRSYADNPEKYKPQYIPNFEVGSAQWMQCITGLALTECKQFPSAKDVTLERRPLVTGDPFEVTPDGYNFFRTLVIGTFMEQFQLHSYPFDVQDLTVIMDMSFALKEDAIFVPWSESYSLEAGGELSMDKSFLRFNRAFSAIPEFHARRVLVEFTVKENCWSQLKFRIQMVRKPEGTLGRVAILCCLLSLSSLCAFSMDPLTNHADRAGFLMTLILAFVAFQFTVTSSLPKTAYLTVLDKYTLASFTFLTLMLGTLSVVEHVYAGIEDAQRIYVDNIIFIVSAIAVAALQLWFFISGMVRRYKELGKLQMSMSDLNAFYDSGSDSKPINVVGTSQMPECLTVHKGDPFCSFQGTEE
jgi:hypothetical protein